MTTAATALALAACSLEPQPKALGLGGAVLFPFCLIACSGSVTLDQTETAAPITIDNDLAPIAGGDLTIAPGGGPAPAATPPPAPPAAAN